VGQRHDEHRAGGQREWDIAAFAAVNTGVAPVIATITVTPHAIGCDGVAQSFTITVNPTPR